MNSILSPNLITTALFFILIIIVILRVLLKKKRSGSDVSYTPFDYITGQTDKAFHESEAEEEKDESDK